MEGGGEADGGRLGALGVQRGVGIGVCFLAVRFYV